MSDTTLPGSYVSVGRFTQSATGIDPANLKAGELARHIFNASRAADGICRQILYATLDTVQMLEDRGAESYSIDLSDGLLKLFFKRFPIRSIVSISQQFASSDSPSLVPASWIHINSDARWAWVEGLWSPYKRQMPPMYLGVSYVNGWLATTLAATANAGQAVIQLVPQPGNATVQGVLAGQTLEIQDSTPELVTVQSVSGNNVTLTANLVNQHLVDTFVVEPFFNELSFGDVQQATLLLTEHSIKFKGIAPLVLKDENVQPSRTSGVTQDLVDEAKALLDPFIVRA
jgi:hypothetical protein